MDTRVATIAGRLRQYMAEEHKKQIDILNACEPYFEECGVSLNKPIISMYVNGRAEPDRPRLHLLALGLKVSEVWLMGYDVPKDRTDVASVPAANKELALGWVDLYASKEELLEMIQYCANKLSDGKK